MKIKIGEFLEQTNELLKEAFVPNPVLAQQMEQEQAMQQQQQMPQPQEQATPQEQQQTGNLPAQSLTDTQVTLSVQELLDLISGGKATSSKVKVDAITAQHQQKMQQMQEKHQQAQQEAQAQKEQEAQMQQGMMGGGGIYSQPLQ